MLIVKVWCLPADQPEDVLRRLHLTIVEEVFKMRVLEVNDEDDMVVLFPPDLMKYGLGKEIVVEVSGLLEKPEITDGVCNELAFNLGARVCHFYQNSRVVCFVQTQNPNRGYAPFCRSTDE